MSSMKGKQSAPFFTHATVSTAAGFDEYSTFTSLPGNKKGLHSPTRKARKEIGSAQVEMESLYGQVRAFEARVAVTDDLEQQVEQLSDQLG